MSTITVGLSAYAIEEAIRSLGEPCILRAHPDAIDRIFSARFATAEIEPPISITKLETRWGTTEVFYDDTLPKDSVMVVAEPEPEFSVPVITK